MAQDAIINRWDINGDVYDIQDAGRGRPLGVATLDENGRVPYTQLPESAVEFKGYWNADTNTPTLHDGTGTKGDLYYVDVAGTQDLGSGSQTFKVGDRVLYDGSVWKNISSGTDPVDIVEDGNMNPVTSNAVANYMSPIDSVTDGEMRPVTSNAVYDYTENIKKSYTIDARSLNSSYFYPVTFDPKDLQLDCEIHSPNVGGASAYNQNEIHFLLMAQGWSDTPKRLAVLQYGVYDANEITIGAIANGTQNGVSCIWVRGGLLYRFICNRTPTLRTANYTYGNEVYTVGTGYSGGTNTNVGVIWSPNTAQGSYFSQPINVSGSIYINGYPIWVS